MNTRWRSSTAFAARSWTGAWNLIRRNRISGSRTDWPRAGRKGGRIHATGIGKRAHLCGYAASLLSSTGTPTYYLHGTEAVHGSCGQLVEGDVVICISNSGETAELKATVQAVRENGGRIVAITGNPASWLAKNADVHLFAGVSQEGDSLNRAPRLSVLAEMMVLQRLSIVLQANYGLTSTPICPVAPPRGGWGSCGRMSAKRRTDPAASVSKKRIKRLL